MISLDVKHGGELSNRILKAVKARVKASKDAHSDYKSEWEDAEKRSVAYLPARDTEKQARIDREQGTPQYTTIQLPYTYAVLLTMHTYLTTVFLGRNPVFQFSARHGEAQNKVLAMEAMMDYQLQVGGAQVPYIFWILDALKMSTGIIGVYWDKEIITTSEITEEEETVLGLKTGRKKKVKRTRQTTGYQGNRVYNVRIQDFFHDPRVPLHDFQSGEYCGVASSISWNRLVEGAKRGRYINLEVVRARALQKDHYREEDSSIISLPDPLDFGTDHVDGKLAADEIATHEVYIELIPREWKLGEGDLPEKWVFTTTSDHTIVMSAMPLGALHNKFPFSVQQAEIDPYGLFPRTISEVIAPLQNTMDWLFNSHMYNVRKVLNNQLVVDPSRLNMKDLSDPLPGGLVRLLPSAYGTSPGDAYEQLQVQDITRSHLTDMDQVMRLGERTHGANDAIMGLTNPSSRRSATEIRSTNSFSVNRLKTIAEFQSAMGWGPHSQMLVQNTQQYYDADMQLRLVGDLAMVSGTQFTQVTPDELSGFYDFVHVDGTLPVDRLAQATLWRELMREMAAIPELLAQYDIARIFAWVAQLTGLKNINQFRVEVIPDAQAQAQQQQGNLVPMPGGRGPNDPTVLPGPRQTNGRAPGGGPVL